LGSQDIGQKRARTRWLTERIASLGQSPAGIPIQMTKTQVRISAQRCEKNCGKNRLKKNRTATFFSAGQMP
jgi:hypothetical protein